MIALHISIHNGQFILWSESEKLGDIKDLKMALKKLTEHYSIEQIKINKSNTVKAFAFLPAQKDEFLPSSPLIKEVKKTKSKPVFKAFPIEALKLSIDNLFILTSLCNQDNLGILMGQSIKAIKALVDLSFDLVLSENYYPVMIKTTEAFEARWAPFYNDDNEKSMYKLIQELPAVCRCISDTDEMQPDISSQFIVNYSINNILDYLVRLSNNSSKKSINSVHDAWLLALKSDHPQIEWPDYKEIQDLYNQIKLWHRPVELSAKSNYKLCFKLNEPLKDDGDWIVEYLIQAKKDQSAFINLDDFWNNKKKKELVAFGNVNNEFILSSLGQASALCPDIANSLKAKKPSSYHLNSSGALIFLKEYVEILKASGFNVLLPSWWLKGNTAERLKLNIKVDTKKMKGSGFLSLNSLYEFDYRASLADESITYKELQALAKLKSSLVKIRGQWVQIDQEQIKLVLKYLDKKNQSISGREILALALGMEKDLGGIVVEQITVEGWMKDFIDQLSGKTTYSLLNQPNSFNGKLRDYQIKGFSWLAFLKQWGLGACLADDMGLGKTIQTLALIQENVDKGESKPSLLICPTSVVNNWKNEVYKFAPQLKIHIHHGNKRLKKNNFTSEISNCHLVISSYGLLQRDLEFLKDNLWASVILDEAQNIKNFETKQSKAARSLTSDFRIALTGTPVENHVGDIFSLMEYLNPGLLGSASSFKTNFLKPIQQYQSIETVKKLKALTSPFILRRLKTDQTIIKDLPDKIEVKDYCTLTKEQASLYQAVVNEMANKVENAKGIERKGLVLSTLLRLKQVCNHPAQYLQDNSSINERSGKIQRLIEILSEINEGGEKTLIFTQFTAMGKMLQQALQEYFCQEVFFLHGSLNKTKRDEMVEAYQNNPKSPKIFILSLKAGGTGLNLTQANHVIHFDRWWNPAVENQATDRAFRIGQNKNVQVHKFIVSGTLEEKIDYMIEQKKLVSEMVVNTGEQWLSELSNEDFKNLIQLSKDATGE